MQLKMEIFKLRKQVLCLWRQVRKHKRNAGQDAVNTVVETA